MYNDEARAKAALKTKAYTGYCSITGGLSFLTKDPEYSV